MPGTVLGVEIFFFLRERHNPLDFYSSGRDGHKNKSLQAAVVEMCTK